MADLHFVRSVHGPFLSVRPTSSKAVRWVYRNLGHYRRLDGGHRLDGNADASVVVEAAERDALTVAFE